MNIIAVFRAADCEKTGGTLRDCIEYRMKGGGMETDRRGRREADPGEHGSRAGEAERGRGRGRRIKFTRYAHRGKPRAAKL